MSSTERDSDFLEHVACSTEDGGCGSSDANGMYSDGHTYCHGCGKYRASDGSSSQEKPKKEKRMAGKVIPLSEQRFVEVSSRKLSARTCEHMDYGRAEFSGQQVQVANYFNADGELVGQKIRMRDKKFCILGTVEDAMPFGYRGGAKGGKKLVITEGEIDAASVAEAQECKWPVWSIPCGADAAEDAKGNPTEAKKIKRLFAGWKEWGLFDGFEEVILMFDNDAPGKHSAKAAARVIGKKAKIAELPLKDANDMLKEGRREELTRAIWNAQAPKMDGIVSMKSIREQGAEAPREGLSYPHESLTKLTYGMRTGECIGLGAGTGIGKTDFFSETAVHLLKHHKRSVGYFALEQSNRTTAVRLAGKQAGVRLHIPDRWDKDTYYKAFDELTADDVDVYLYDSFGAANWDSIKEKIEYLHSVHGVRYFFLDHLTALTAFEDDVNKALLRIMAEMSALCEDLDIFIMFISHLNRPKQGPAHEEGGRVTIANFIGSSAMGFWAHYLFAMERNQQHEDERWRTITTFRILKDRFTGDATGKTFLLGFDSETGKMYVTEPPGEAADNMGFEPEPEEGTQGDKPDF